MSHSTSARHAVCQPRLQCSARAPVEQQAPIRCSARLRLQPDPATQRAVVPTQQRCSPLRRAAALRAAANSGAAATPAAEGEEAQQQQQQRPPFDLGLAVTLAGCAFEAYNDPIGADTGFVERAANGTCTTFLDKQYLEQHIKGLLQVHLKSATNLNAADPWGTSDPYCVLTVGDSSHTSAVINRNLSPKWDERFFLFVRDPAKQRLTIKVADKDYLTSDDALGSTMVPLAALVAAEEGRAPSPPRELDLPLVGGGKGQVQLELSYVPLDGATAASASSGSSPLQGPLPQLSSVPRPWRLLAQVSGVGAEVVEELQPVAFVDNQDTDTQAWVLVNRQLKHVCVAWRGTEQDKWKDLLTDASLVPSALNPERVAAGEVAWTKMQQAEGGPGDEGPMGALGAVTSLARSVLQKGATDSTSTASKVLRAARQLMAANTVDEPLVHGGFLGAYDSVHSRVISMVEELVAGGEDGEWTVYVTGHSLGGALATLCAYELSCHKYQSGGTPGIAMYNYGSPRVGNVAFAKDYNSRVPYSWRVSNTKDIVTSVPRLMGYCHIGGVARLLADGSISIEDAGQGQAAGTAVDGDTAAYIGEGSSLEEVTLALAEKLLEDDVSGAGGKADRMAAIQGLVQQELDILATIMDGSAINEHMEDLYLEAIKQLVVAERKLSPELLASIVVQAPVTSSSSARSSSKDANSGKGEGQK